MAEALPLARIGGSLDARTGSDSSTRGTVGRGGSRPDDAGRSDLIRCEVRGRARCGATRRGRAWRAADTGRREGLRAARRLSGHPPPGGLRTARVLAGYLWNARVFGSHGGCACRFRRRRSRSGSAKRPASSRPPWPSGSRERNRTAEPPSRSGSRSRSGPGGGRLAGTIRRALGIGGRAASDGAGRRSSSSAGPSRPVGSTSVRQPNASGAPRAAKPPLHGLGRRAMMSGHAE